MQSRLSILRMRDASDASMVNSMKEESDAWLDIEGKSLARANAETVAKLDEKEKLSDWNEWVAKDLAQDDWVVEAQAVESYALPVAARSYLGDELVSSWNRIVEEICSVHNQVVGMRVSRAGAVLSGDERIAGFNRELRLWADAYIERRLVRISHKRFDVVEQFEFLYKEFLPHLDLIAFRVGSGNRWFLSELADYFPTQLYLKTIRPLYAFKFDSTEMLSWFKILSTEPSVIEYLVKLVDMYKWQQMDDLVGVAAVLEKDESWSFSLSSEQIRRRLEFLVDDIQEMRPFLRHNYKAENVVIELVPGVVISFRWAVGRGVGLVLIAPSLSEMIVHHRRSTSALSLSIGYDGQLANYATPWIDAESVLERCPLVLQSNLRILEAIHAKLFALYEKVDVAAVLARFRKRIEQPAVESEDNEPTDEEFAAVCQSIAEPVVEPESYSGGPASVGMKAVRVQRLMAILQDKLNCEVRQGKGSEIVVYREGGHHFRLGHHKRNSYVPVAVIKNLLRHVGIRFREWLDVLV